MPDMQQNTGQSNWADCATGDAGIRITFASLLVLLLLLDRKLAVWLRVAPANATVPASPKQSNINAVRI